MRSLLYISTLLGLSQMSLGSAQVRYVDETKFTTSAELHSMLSNVGGMGFRAPGSVRQNNVIRWLEAQLDTLPGMKISKQTSTLHKWHTKHDQSLAQAACLHLTGNGTDEQVPIAGAIPYTLPTNGSSLTGPLIYVPPGTNLTSVDIKGKIVLREFGPTSAVPYSLLFLISHYRSNDTDALANNTYDRPYTGAPGQDISDAGAGGAKGYVSMFNVPRGQIESYYDPHDGTQHSVPGVYVGAEERAILKSAAEAGMSASIDVEADIGWTQQTTLSAVLPGQVEDTVYIVSHTDGNTWVQDNGPVAMLALAKYFATQCTTLRNKTLEFVFTTGHLAYAYDTTYSLGAQLDKTYDEGKTALVIALEHMGTREILPQGSTSGAANGQPLEFTGEGEINVWCVGPSQALVDAAISCAKHRDLARTVITPGASYPNASQVPTYNSFGGIGTGFHDYLVPTTSIIAGPWSLWAPVFGADAIDFERFRNEILAFGDLILAVDGMSNVQIAGDYIKKRQQRADGFPTSPPVIPPRFDPEF